MPRMADKHIPTAALRRWVEQLWLAAGCSADEARLTAEHLVGANLAGHDSHGVGMVPRYVSSWLAGELQLNQHVAITSDSGAMLSLDAQRGMGQSMAFEAMNLAIERAKTHGVCVMGLKNAHHIGRIGHWAEQAVAAGMVSVHFVNAHEQAGGGALPRHRGALRHQPLHRRHPGAGARADAAGLCHQRHRHGQGARGLQQRQAGARRTC